MNSPQIRNLRGILFSLYLYICIIFHALRHCLSVQRRKCRPPVRRPKHRSGLLPAPSTAPVPWILQIHIPEYSYAYSVLPRYQHQGIGKKLLEVVFRHQSELTLAVYEENKNAVLFYKKMGFQIIDRQLNVDSGKAEYIMKKRVLM